MARAMPRSAQARKIAAADFSARSQAWVRRCCEPTWNDTPWASSPSRWACSSTSAAIAGVAAELARQRPFGAGAVEQEAAEHPRAGRGAGDLLDLGLAVDREQPHPQREGAGDVALLLDGVAVGDAVGRGAGRQHHLDLGHRCGVEARAEPGEQRQHFRRRVRLDGIEHPRIRQRVGECLVVVAHDFEIDDEARPVFAAMAQELVDALSHGALPNRLEERQAARYDAGLRGRADARWGRADARAQNPV